MKPDDILLVLSMMALWVNALAVVWLVMFVRRQLNHFREKEFLETIRDEKFRFPQDLRADETPLAGRYVRHWILNQKSIMSYDRYSKHSYRVQTAILEVLMAYDRVVYDFDLGLSKRAVIRYQGDQLRKVWDVMQSVIIQLRREPNGIPLFCVALQSFVESKEFERLSARYCVAQGRHVVD